MFIAVIENKIIRPRRGRIKPVIQIATDMQSLRDSKINGALSTKYYSLTRRIVRAVRVVARRSKNSIALLLFQFHVLVTAPPYAMLKKADITIYYMLSINCIKAIDSSTNFSVFTMLILSLGVCVISCELKFSINTFEAIAIAGTP